MEQLTLDLFGRRTPGDCPDEGKVAGIGGGKSWCTPWGRWTNCREWGRCVWEMCGFATGPEDDEGDEG